MYTRINVTFGGKGGWSAQIFGSGSQPTFAHSLTQVDRITVGDLGLELNASNNDGDLTVRLQTVMGTKGKDKGHPRGSFVVKGGGKGKGKGKGKDKNHGKGKDKDKGPDNGGDPLFDALLPIPIQADGAEDLNQVLFPDRERSRSPHVR